MALYGASDKLVDGYEADKNGQASISLTSNTGELEISYVGHQTARIKVQDVKGYDVTIGLDIANTKSTGCFGYSRHTITANLNEGGLVLEDRQFVAKKDKL